MPFTVYAPFAYNADFAKDQMMRVVQKALTFDDVLLVPAHSAVLPREVSLKTRLTRTINLNIPVVANNAPFLLKSKERNKLSSTKLFKIKSWNQDVLVNTKQINFDFKGIKPTFLVTFENNKIICLTSNHRILSRNGWIRASQLQKDTEVYCLLQTENKRIFKYNYSKVENVTYQGTNEVYDKTILGFHNYLSKNIILHNSIEQDADIVIMLYREEYYKENTSEEQITEVIVAKHRNGPVGTAKLLFKPSVTSFVNL